MCTIAITNRHIVCPACEKPDATFDHLSGTRIGFNTSWYCNQCGAQYSFDYTDGEVSNLKVTGAKRETRLVLLRAGRVGLVVEARVYIKGSGPTIGETLPDAALEEAHHHQYHYEEHTCPINFMKDVRAVVDIEKSDTDPHGIFEYVATLPWNDKVTECNNDAYLETLLPAFEEHV